MAESAKIDSVKTGTEASEQFAKIVDRLVREFVKPAVLPTVRAGAVEKVGLLMVRNGYQMTEWSVNVLTDYLKGYNLWLCGKPGVGKTFFFDCMSRVRASLGHDAIAKLSMVDTQGWSMDMARDWVEENRDRNVLIDDVGTEPEEQTSYGQRIELFQYLLEKRMQLPRVRTHMTSNFGAKDIVKRYGLRVADRFVQMFKTHVYPDVVGGKRTGSRRTLAPWRTSRDGGGVL